MEIEMLPVDSTNLESVGYDGIAQKLRVLFKSGQLFEYSQLPANVFDDMMHSPSPGKFFADQIAKRGSAKYPFARIS